MAPGPPRGAAPAPAPEVRMMRLPLRRSAPRPDPAGAKPVVVFLHIPKTAGQSVHRGMVEAIGEAAVSPVRVHSQAEPGAAQFPPGYRLYSGHIDWDALDTLPPDRFVFSVLRDPLERIASFYFYLRSQAATLDAAELARPERTGMRRILECSAEEYFFGGDAGWQRFVRDHYDNNYCAYFATRKLRGRAALDGLPEAEILARALAGAQGIDRVYGIDELDALEADLARVLGRRPRISGRVVNAGPGARATPRWPQLRALIPDPEKRARLEGFAALDMALMRRLGIDPATGRGTGGGPDPETDAGPRSGPAG